VTRVVRQVGQGADGDRLCMHEFVAQGIVKGSDVRALDIAKRLIDLGHSHLPTIYFRTTA
jgi:glycine cleavage system protein P-like pyridoxal-binding family